MKYQEPVRRETTDDSFEFMGYRMPPHEHKMAAQSYSEGIDQQWSLRLFRYSKWLSRYRHPKLE